MVHCLEVALEVLDPFQKLKHEDCSYLLEDTTTESPCERACCPGVQAQACQGPRHSLRVSCLMPHPFMVMIHVVLLILGLLPFENLTLILRGSNNARSKFFLQSRRSGSVFGEGYSGIPNCSGVPALGAVREL